MEVKEWLQGLQRIEKRINAKNAQIEKYRRMAMLATSSTEATRISGASNRSRVEDAVISICGVEEDVREELDALRQYRRDAMMVIRSVSDARCRDVLEWRCVNGWSFTHIAVELGCEEQWAKMLYGKALNEARKIVAGMDDLMLKYHLTILDYTVLT